MNPRTHMLIATASFLIAAAVMARAAPGDPPPNSLDLGAIKPKSDTTPTVNSGSLIPVSPSQLQKQKAAADAATASNISNTAGTGATGNAGNTGVGTAIKSPLGTKSVSGGPVTGSKPAQPAQDDAATSNDVVVKMPSNMKK